MGFEIMTPGFEQMKIFHALDCAAAANGILYEVL
jgi:hypothetical protein